MVRVDRLVHDARQNADRGEVDETWHPERDHRLDEVDHAAEVHLEGRRAVRRQVGGVEDHARVDDLVRAVNAEDVEHPRLVADGRELERQRVDVRADDEARLGRERLNVEGYHRAARVEQLANEVAADEARTPPVTSVVRSPTGLRSTSRVPMSTSGRAIPCV